MKNKVAVLLAAVVAVCSAPSFAAYPLATDDAGTVARNTCELEASYDSFKDGENLANQFGGVSFKHGLTEKMDVGLSVPYQVHPAAAERVGAASLALKFSLVKDVLAFSVANELGEKEYFLNAVYSKELAVVKLSLNAGYLSTGDETKKGRGAYGLAAEYPMGKYEAAAELQGTEGGAGSMLVGLRYWLKDTLFVSSGVARALEADRYRVTAGFHLEF